MQTEHAKRFLCAGENLSLPSVIFNASLVDSVVSSR